MGHKYRQFSVEERCELARLSAAGGSIRQVAAALDRAPSSVARELKRNRTAAGNYQPGFAQQQAAARRWSGSRLDRNAALRETVLGQLAQGWSPEQIVGRASRARADAEGRQASVGVETIYRFIHAQIVRHKDYGWRHYLPRGRFRRGWRGRRGGSPALLMRLRVPLGERPADVADRQVPGHWEADLMGFSRYNQHLLVLHERMSRALIAARLPSKHAEPVARALGATLGALPPALRRTVTFDNGTEFARHHELHAFGVATYFCDPHAPWQKGGVENAIGRMRLQLPRKTNLAELDDVSLGAAITAYNNTPRKCLDWRTPAEAFSQHLLHFKRESTFPPARE